MCQRHFCESCGQEMIHRDNRKIYESASALGQIVSHMRHTFTFGDVDGYTYKRTLKLLRLVEHKQPHQQPKGPQLEALRIIDDAIAGLVDAGELHKESGVYIMRGELRPADGGYQECQLAGPQEVGNWRLGSSMIEDEDELFEWFDGGDLS